jgi:hypothetical protein
MKGWAELVERSLKLESYETEQDIKDALRTRFKSGNRTDGNVGVWEEYLVRLDELNRKHSALAEWSELWIEACKKGIETTPIPFDFPIGEIETRIVSLKGILERDVVR